MNKETVCAVVVTYNRKELLIECLDALKNQTRPLDGIYLIDNASTDKTPEFLLEKGYIKELPPENLSEPWEKEFNIKLPNGKQILLHYVRMNENTGGAGGFHEGVKRGYEKGYDWLWLMDDDVEPLEKALETQLSYQNISKVIHPSKMYKNGERFLWEAYIEERSGFSIPLFDEFLKNGKKYTCVNYGCFEGMLIHKDVISKIGLPEKKFFSVGDDTYYGYKASKVENNIYIYNICFVKKIYKKNNSKNYLPIYLNFRNKYFYIYRKIAKNKFIWFLLSAHVLFRFTLSSLKHQRINAIYYAYKGTKDGLNENFDNSIIKKLLK